MTLSSVLGAPPHDLARLTGGAAIVLSFALLARRRIGAMISAYALQGAVVAAALAWQGWARSNPALYAAAALALAVKVTLIPAALRRLARGPGAHAADPPALGAVPSMALGVAMVALCLLAAPPAASQPPGQDPAAALSVALIGMLTMITRRGAVGQAIGFLSLENAIGLAAPGDVALSLAGLALAAVLALGLARGRPDRAGLEAR